MEDFLDDLDLFRWPQLQHDAVGFQVLLLTTVQTSLENPILVDQFAAQSIGERAAGPKPERGYSALPGMDLCGQLATKFGGHDALEVLDDARQQAAVVIELFRAVIDGDAGLPTQKFIVRALVNIS